MKIALLVPLLVAAFGCGKPALQTNNPPRPSISPDVLAEIGSTKITRQDFAQEIDRRGRGPATEIERDEWLQELVRREALFVNAGADGLDQDPEIQLVFKKMVVGKYLEQRRSSSPFSASAQEIEGFYRAHSSEFMRPDSVQFAVIFISSSVKATSEKRAEMFDRANEIRMEAAAKPETFSNLAERFSDDNATRFRGGDAGTLVADLLPGRWPSSVIQAVFAMRSPDEVSSVTEAADGFYILKLIRREEASLRPLPEVEPLIKRRLEEAAARREEERFFAIQFARAKVVMYPGAVNSVPLSSTALAQASAPPSMPR